MAITQDQIEQSRTQAQQSGQSAIDFASKSSQVQQELSQALKGSLADSGIIEKRSEALADYMAAPGESRAMYGDPEGQSFIFNPWQRDALISQNVAQARIPYSSLSDYFMMQNESIPQIVSSYGNLYNSQANALAQAAQLQRQGYTDLLGEYGMQQDEAYRQQQLALERARLPRSWGGIGSILSIEPEPQYTPMQNGSISPGGEWQFQDNKWVPTGASQTGGGFGLGGIDTSDPRNMLALMALGQADSPSEILAATNILFPEENRITLEKKNQFKNAANLLTEVVNLSGTAPPGMHGFIMSNLGRVPGVYGGDAEQLRRVSRGLAKAIADVFAVGESRPTDVDVDRWLGLMPREGDTVKERQIASKRLVGQMISEASAKGIQLPEDVVKIAINLNILEQ